MVRNYCFCITSDALRSRLQPGSEGHILDWSTLAATNISALQPHSRFAAGSGCYSIPCTLAPCSVGHQLACTVVRGHIRRQACQVSRHRACYGSVQCTLRRCRAAFR